MAASIARAQKLRDERQAAAKVEAEAAAVSLVEAARAGAVAAAAAAAATAAAEAAAALTPCCRSCVCVCPTPVPQFFRRRLRARPISKARISLRPRHCYVPLMWRNSQDFFVNSKGAWCYAPQVMGSYLPGHSTDCEAWQRYMWDFSIAH